MREVTMKERRALSAAGLTDRGIRRLPYGFQAFVSPAGPGDTEVFPFGSGRGGETRALLEAARAAKRLRAKRGRGLAAKALPLSELSRRASLIRWRRRSRRP